MAADYPTPTERATRTERLADFLVHLLGHTHCTGYALTQIEQSGVETAAITCLRCGLSSFNPTDIAEKYCGACHVFHEERPLMKEDKIDGP
jgi:ribosomal protein S27AE